MNVLVTGGAGFIGSHLVDRLVHKRIGPVTVLDNLRRGALANLSLSWDAIEFIEGDIRNLEVVDQAMRGKDLVYHLAAQSNVLGALQDLDYSFTTNVVGTFNILRAASRAKVRRLVFTSSREVYGDPESVPVSETAPLRPKNAYGASKVAGEVYCNVFAERGLETCILRLANVYGPRDYDRVIPIFVQNALAGRPLTIYGSNKVLDFIWFNSVLDALQLVGTGEPLGSPINIGSGCGTRMAELAARVLVCTGSASTVETVANRETEVSRFIADISQAVALGWKNAGDPLAHLPDLVRAYIQENAAGSGRLTRN